MFIIYYILIPIPRFPFPDVFHSHVSIPASRPARGFEFPAEAKHQDRLYVSYIAQLRQLKIAKTNTNTGNNITVISLTLCI